MGKYVNQTWKRPKIYILAFMIELFKPIFGISVFLYILGKLWAWSTPKMNIRIIIITSLFHSLLYLAMLTTMKWKNDIAPANCPSYQLVSDFTYSFMLHMLSMRTSHALAMLIAVWYKWPINQLPSNIVIKEAFKKKR